MTRASLLTFVAALALGGCIEGPRSALTQTDSAGVEIVTNLPVTAESAERWTLSPEPGVEIGARTDPDVALHQVTAVAPLDAGRVAVGTNAPPQARVFESDGTLAATLGREGDGPGEFASVGSIVPIADDSIAMWDPDRRRISVFTGDGRFAREVDLSDVAPLSARASAGMGPEAGLTHLLPTASGDVVLFAEGVFSANPDPGTRRPELPAVRLTTAGEEVASYGRFPGMEWVYGGPAGALPLPFGARTYATTSGDVLVAGTAESTEIRMFGPSGRLTRIVRWPDHDRSVEGPFLSRWSEWVDSQAEMKDLVESMPRRERFPAYEGLVATDEGEILVGDYAGPLGIWPVRRADHGPVMLQPMMRTPARRWLVFDADGALVATVETPAGFEPYAVRGGRMWGVFVDEFDVESVRGYDLRRR